MHGQKMLLHPVVNDFTSLDGTDVIDTKQAWQEAIIMSIL
jgi:hypothetical protein